MLRTIASPSPWRPPATPVTSDPNATLALLALAMASSSRKQYSPEVQRLRAMTLWDFCHETYAPGKGLPPGGSTVELAEQALKKLRDCVGYDPTVAEARSDLVDRFRDYLSGLVAASKLRASTANKHLRHLRAVVNYAAKKRAVRRLPILDFLPEQEPEVEAWTPDDLARIEAQARTLTGTVAGIPAAPWWTAWSLVLSRVGCRVGAMMATERTDYHRGVLLLRRENQKQKRDQRLALSPRAAAAVETLLELHGEPRIFPWPHDPQRPGRKRNFKCLFAHFRRQLLTPCGFALPAGVVTRQFRRTAATIIDERGGNAQKQLGHASERTTRRYKDRKRMPICREGLLIPETSAQQLELF